MPREAYNRIFPPVVSSATIIKVFILESLTKQESQYGYQITKDLNDQFADGDLGWTPPSGQIYRVLKDMEVEGFVESEWEPAPTIHDRPTRRMWKLTEAGRQAKYDLTEQNLDIILSAIRTVVRVGVTLYGHNVVAEAVGKAMFSQEGPRNTK